MAVIPAQEKRVKVSDLDRERRVKTKITTPETAEFIRRFLLHILPIGFVRIRQFGFLANRARGKKPALCRALLGAPEKPEKPAVIDNGG